MPPWFADPAHGMFANDARLTPQQIDTIVRWVDGGALRGNPADEPKLPALTEGWQLGEPDYIITLPHRERSRRREGTTFPTPNLTLDIPGRSLDSRLEIRPSNREVTHHSVIFTAPRWRAGRRRGRRVGIFRRARRVGRRHAADGVPGRHGTLAAQGPATAHQPALSPERQAATDQTRVGLYWGKGELKKEVASALAGDLTFQIPPRAKNHEMRAVYVVDQDINVVSYFPHMHLRGKDMTMTATLPDGRRQTLLSVPAYDFNWQLFYYPKERSRCRAARAWTSWRTTTTRRTTRTIPIPTRGDVRRAVDRRDDVRAVRVRAERRRFAEAGDARNAHRRAARDACRPTRPIASW